MSESITYLIAYAVEAAVVCYYFLYVVKNRPKYSNAVLTTACLYLIQFLGHYFRMPLLNIFLFVVANIILAVFVFKLKVTSAIFHCLLLTSIMCVTEVFAGYVIGSLYPNYEVADLQYSIFVLYFMFSKISYVLLVWIAAQVFSKNKREVTNNIIIAVPILMMVLSVAMVLSFFVITKDVAISRKNEIIVISCSFFSLIVCILSIWFYEFTMISSDMIAELMVERQSEEDVIETNEKMTDLYNNQRILIHDIKKHLATLQDYADSGDYKELDSYLKKVIGMQELNSRVNYCGNKRLNILLGRYNNVCLGKGIDFDVDVQSDNIDYLTPEDITSLFANILDNSVEAAYKSDEAMIDVIIRDEKNSLTIVVRNTCNKEPVFDSSGNLVTNKEDKAFHGLGMKSIEKIVNKYSGKLEVSYDDVFNIFTIKSVLNIK